MRYFEVDSKAKAGLILLAFVISQAATNAQSILAISKKEHTLSIVDPISFKILAKIPVGQDPHEVIASSDGRKAYVTIYGGGSLHELNVIDLVNKKAENNIDTKPLFGPHGIDYANGKVWFTAEGSKLIASYDPQTGQIDWTMGTGQNRTHMIYVTPDGKKMYTSNVSSGTVSILQDSLLQPGRFGPPDAKPRHEWIHTVIPTEKESEGFDVTPDGKELWTASSENGKISIIDLVAIKLSAKIDAKVEGANRLKITPDGKFALITSLRNGELTIIDIKSHKEVKRMKVGTGAAGILMDPNGTRAFIACSADNYIAVLDLKTLEIVKHFDVGGEPDGLAWAVSK